MRISTFSRSANEGPRAKSDSPAVMNTAAMMAAVGLVIVVGVLYAALRFVVERRMRPNLNLPGVRALWIGQLQQNGDNHN